MMADIWFVRNVHRIPKVFERGIRPDLGVFNVLVYQVYAKEQCRLPQRSAKSKTTGSLVCPTYTQIGSSQVNNGILLPDSFRSNAEIVNGSPSYNIVSKAIEAACREVLTSRQHDNRA